MPKSPPPSTSCSPNLSSSLASLQSALTASDRAARLLLSPTSVKTGDTGSTEEPYSATAELAASVADHSSSTEEDFASAQGDDEGLSTPPRSHKREVSPKIGSHAPSKVDILSDSSWSQLGSPSPSPSPFPLPFHRGEEPSPFLPDPGVAQHYRKEEHVYIKEEDCSDDGHELRREWPETPSAPGEDDGDIDEYCRPVTSSQQERAELALRSRRSQSDFSRWLEETMAMAKGSGESVVSCLVPSSLSRTLTVVGVLP
jgi:hypothetical protein